MNAPPPPTAPFRRLAWRLAGRVLFRITPHTWYTPRRVLLGMFGARLARTAKFRRSVRIDCPWNVRADHLAIFGDDVLLLAADASIHVGERCVVSQYATLATSVRDHRRAGFPPRIAPIVIEDDCWIATDTLVMPGAHVRAGTVVGARALVEGELPGWTIATGEPARPRKPRVLRAPS